MEPDNKQIRQALLNRGSLNAFDPATVEFVESELVEEYLENSLRDDETELFNANFMVTDQRRDLMNELRLLKRMSSGAIVFDASEIEAVVATKAASGAPPTSSRIGSIILVLVIIGVILFIAWKLLQR